MDSLPILIGLFLVGAWFEVFAVRRHKEFIRLLTDIRTDVNSIYFQTDIRRAERLHNVLAQLRKEFSDFDVQESFAERIYHSARMETQDLVRLAREGGLRNNLDRFKENRETLDIILLASLDDSTQRYLNGLPKEELFQKLTRARAAAK